MAYAISGCTGADFDKRTADDSPEFDVGTTVIGSDGYMYVYVHANGAIAASQTDVTVNASTFEASDGSGAYVNTTAFADNEYGWCRSPLLPGAA